MGTSRVISIQYPYRGEILHGHNLGRASIFQGAWIITEGHPTDALQLARKIASVILEGDTPWHIRQINFIHPLERGLGVNMDSRWQCEIFAEVKNYAS